MCSSIAFAYSHPSIHPSLHPSLRPSLRPSSPPSPLRHPKFIHISAANHQHQTTTTTTQSSKNTLPTTPTPQPHLTKSLSILLLNFVTLLWGTQHAVIKLAIENTSPSTINLSRFFIAALISLPSLPPPSPQVLRTYIAGAELSLYLFLGYALQSISLLTTSASRSGFLLYLNVKLVPIFARLLYNRPITPLVWTSAALALFGTALLTYDASPPSLGDVWSILAAAASAMFILRLETASKYSPKAINAISLTSVSILCAIWSFLTNPPTTFPNFATLLPSSPTAITAVLYLGIVTTALTNYLQTLGQKHIPAQQAAVIFAMDPVYGAFFASALLGESLGQRGIAGAACIAIAAVLSNTDFAKHLTQNLSRLEQWWRNE